MVSESIIITYDDMISKVAEAPPFLSDQMRRRENSASVLCKHICCDDRVTYKLVP